MGPVPELAVHGVGFLLYGLLDVVVDGYFDVVQAFDEYYDEISEGIFDERPLDAAKQRHWFHMRRALVRFHRLVSPIRESGEHADAPRAHRHPRGPLPLLPGRVRPHPACKRVDGFPAGPGGTIVETNLSLRDYRQNQIVKKVSSWAAIIAVPALVTGYYGMNVPYPGSGDSGGSSCPR